MTNVTVTLPTNDTPTHLLRAAEFEGGKFDATLFTVSVIKVLDTDRKTEINCVFSKHETLTDITFAADVDGVGSIGIIINKKSSTAVFATDGDADKLFVVLDLHLIDPVPKADEPEVVEEPVTGADAE